MNTFYIRNVFVIRLFIRKKLSDDRSLILYTSKSKGSNAEYFGVQSRAL